MGFLPGGLLRTLNPMEPIKVVVAIEPLLFATALLSILQRDDRFSPSLAFAGDRSSIAAADLVFCSKPLRGASVRIQLDPESSVVRSYSEGQAHLFPYTGLGDLVEIAFDAFNIHRNRDALISDARAGPDLSAPPGEIPGGVPDA